MLPLAFESPFLLSIVALFSAGVWLMFWTLYRRSYMLLLATSFGVLCPYWGLLAISAGPAPVLDRGDIALIVRVLGIVAALLMAGAMAARLRYWWRTRGVHLVRGGDAQRDLT